MNIIFRSIICFTAACFFQFCVVTFSSAAQNADYSVRLKGGSREGEGLLEVYFGKRWYRVCNQKWDVRGSIIVCKQLGFTKVSRKEQSGQSNYLPEEDEEDVSYIEKHFLCEGSENDLGSCHLDWIEDCKLGKEVWVSCSNKLKINITHPVASEASGKISQLPIRLVNNRLTDADIISNGILEIFHGQEWSRVCADGWDKMDSFVACGQLGYPSAKDQIPSNDPHEYSVMTHVNCTGSESSLLSCNHAGFGEHLCKTKLSVFLSCNAGRDQAGNPLGEINHKIGKVRLRAGTRYSEGRAEVFFDEKWGTVCDDQWDLKDGNVLCRQLGFGTAAFVSHWATDYGQGTGPILMADVGCNGTESDVRTCVHANRTEANCGHEEDAGVRCNYPKPTVQNVRLTGSRSPFEGRVEVRYKDRWYAVCGVSFHRNEGQVICRQLGLGYVGDAFSTIKYGVTKIGLYKVHCTGKEDSLFDCKHSPWFKRDVCRFYDMASVKCIHALPDLTLDGEALRTSIKLVSHPLRNLRCSRSENCLSSSAYTRYAYFNRASATRRLLVFTSRILNKGTSSFRPNIHRDRWVWHSCHKHFHSMERFSDYDLIDFHGRKIAEGHKASFCLEDSDCDKGVKKMFNCENKGEQGISVGCADNYKNSIDCQWIDITDTKEGNYSLLIHLNPKQLVMETEYENNIAACEIHYHDRIIDVGRCSSEPCTVRSYGGTGYGMCCHFPFVYGNNTYYSCTDVAYDQPWCGTTTNVDSDQKWGYCKEQTEPTRS